MNFRERYGRLDRILYRVAFRAGRAQRALADLEEMVYGDALKDITVDDPVFISALPRSGTTILLRLLWQTGAFASHTYQDMPLVLCPLFWSQYARRFSTDIDAQERMHGDGIRVSGKSPEAFEEMIWKHFWPDHYGEDHIRPWTPGEHNQEFDNFFESHMRKVIAIRREQVASRGRYLSKNNLNIARLAAPPEPLRRGTFLIPFRDPLQQAASMLNQHRRLLEIQEGDDFVREYMEAIGHHEFGKSLRPVNFGGWLEDAAEPGELAFWVQYWLAAYRFILEHAGESSVLISYRRLVDEPASVLRRLEELLGVPENELASQADQLHPPRTHAVEKGELSDTLLEGASETYKRLERRAAV